MTRESAKKKSSSSKAPALAQARKSATKQDKKKIAKKTAKKTAKKRSAKKPTNDKKKTVNTVSKTKSNKPNRKNQNKTRPTGISPEDFIQTVDNESRRNDALFLLQWLSDLTGLKPHMWGGSIIGYGRYHYRYDTGREGDFLMTGFSPRKTALVLYIMPGYLSIQDKLERLGKHKIGKSCLYINKLSDVDMEVLAEIVKYGIEFLEQGYETFPE